MRNRPLDTLPEQAHACACAQAIKILRRTSEAVVLFSAQVPSHRNIKQTRPTLLRPAYNKNDSASALLHAGIRHGRPSCWPHLGRRRHLGLPGGAAGAMAAFWERLARLAPILSQGRQGFSAHQAQSRSGSAYRRSEATPKG